MKLFGLIGYPLKHSFSKKYFEEKFASENLHDHFFDIFPLAHVDEFPGLISDHRFSGLAVTIPHKQTIIPFLNDVDSIAKNIGAVNCIRFNGEMLIGYNTDAIGFERSFLPLLRSVHRKALVLGSGGSSRAIQYVLTKKGIDFLTVSRRKNTDNKSIVYAQVNERIMQDHTVIINCTPAGMTPNEQSIPDLPYQFLTENHLLYDLVYTSEKTAFLLKGEERNCLIKNGLEMLHVQAEENWKIWNVDLEI